MFPLVKEPKQKQEAFDGDSYFEQPGKLWEISAIKTKETQTKYGDDTSNILINWNYWAVWNY